MYEGNLKSEQKSTDTSEKTGNGNQLGGDNWGSTGLRGSGGGRGRRRAGGRRTGSLGRLTVGVTALGRGGGNSGGSTLTVELVTLDVTGAVQLDKGVTGQQTSRGQVKATSNSVQLGEATVVESTVNGNGTTNGGQVREVRERLQLVVALDAEGTADRLQCWETKLLNLVVLVNSERVTNVGQHWEVERLETVRLQGKRTVDGGQVTNRKRSNLLENDVLGSGQLVQVHIDLVGVVVDSQGVSNGGQTGIDTGNVGVVADLEVGQLVHINTSQRSQTSVGEQNAVSRSDTRSQTGGGQGWQSVVNQRTNGGQLGQVNATQNGGVRNSELSGNQLQGWSNEGGGLLSTVDSQVTVDLLDTSDVNGTKGVTGNQNVTDGGRTSGNLGNLGRNSSGEAAERTGQGHRWGGCGQSRVVGSSQAGNGGDGNQGFELHSD